MTDDNEYLDEAEKYESTIKLLENLPKDLKFCKEILEKDEDIIEDSGDDDDLAGVAQDMILIIEALESIEESKIFDDLLDADIGQELSDGMDHVQGYLLEHEIFSQRDDHEVCTKGMELLDIISRLLSDDE